MMRANARIECGLMRLEQRPLIGFLVNPFGLTAKAVELDGNSLRVLRRRRIEVISLQAVSAAPFMRRGLVASRLVVPLADAADIVLKGARGGEIAPFAAHINEAWIRVTLEALESARPRIDRLLAELRGLAKPVFYPAACLMESLLTEARALDMGVLSKLSHEAVGAAEMKKIAPIRKFTADPKAARDTAIASFTKAELERWKDFFDTIESQPLTKEQRLAVVVDEDATLVLAGAGSGKTSVIATKASYLVKAEIRAPDEILLLAFAKKAAEEMTERLKKHGVPIEAYTFHGLGNHIIGKVEGSKPVVAAHASDSFAFLDLIKQILQDLVHQLTEIIDWFAHYLIMPKTKWDFKSKREYHAYMEDQDLRTLQGESVKSYEELQIANWLYKNGIEYKYEAKYEHNLPADGRRVYQPDFWLVESGIYIEHFGVRRDEHGHFTTAPDVDCEKYLKGMKEKQEIHEEYGTHLVETFSDDFQKGDWQTKLKEKLVAHDVTFRLRPKEEIYDRVVEMGQVDKFTQLLGTFLKKFKSGNYTIEDCNERAKTLNFGKRGRVFLNIFKHVYEEYQKRLGKEIDFEDMLSRAAGYVESGKYISPFRHILIDEFQDISQGRARLIKALKAQHSETRIFAVGDDWQSIFRFTGADIHLMRDFGTEFGGSFDGEAGVREVDLGHTFRSVDKIALAARKFVLENPEQIEKQILPASTTTKPVIRIVPMTDNGNKRKFTKTNTETNSKLIEVLEKLSKRATKDGKSTSVFLLGRYRFVEPNTRYLKQRFPNLKIDFMTIHKSKGLEADHVILLNADRGRNGFPSEITDDALLSLVSAKEEKYPNNEERRVMYVAMTRARESLTILASKAHPSAFVTELKNDPKYDIVHEDDADEEDYECGECGGRLLKIKSQKNGRIWYRCEYKLCENFLPACPKCKNGLPRQDDDKSDTIKCSCGATYPPCPICDEGWLIKREGDHFDPFFSCARFPHCTGKVNLK